MFFLLERKVRAAGGNKLAYIYTRLQASDLNGKFYFKKRHKIALKSLKHADLSQQSRGPSHCRRPHHAPPKQLIATMQD